MKCFMMVILFQVQEKERPTGRTELRNEVALVNLCGLMVKLALNLAVSVTKFGFNLS